MTEQSYTICLTEAVARNPEVRLAAPVSLELKPGEHVAIVGPNGAGKSLLVDLLTGKYPLLSGSVAYDFRPSVRRAVYENVRYLAFRDTYGSADANYYYQQRWNAHDQDEVPLVRELLGAYEDSEEVRRLFELFRLDVLMDKPGHPAVQRRIEEVPVGQGFVGCSAHPYHGQSFHRAGCRGAGVVGRCADEAVGAGDVADCPGAVGGKGHPVVHHPCGACGRAPGGGEGVTRSLAG